MPDSAEIERLELSARAAEHSRLTHAFPGEQVDFPRRIERSGRLNFIRRGKLRVDLHLGEGPPLRSLLQGIQVEGWQTEPVPLRQQVVLIRNAVHARGELANPRKRRLLLLLRLLGHRSHR